MKSRLRRMLVSAALAVAAACDQAPTHGQEERAPETKLLLRSGDDLQGALDAALPGDVITLEAGVTFTGPFTLRNKAGDEWVTIRSSEEASLPPPGSRVSPSAANYMPKLEAASGTVLETELGAHHYRFVGIEIRPSRGTFLFNMVTLGRDESSTDQLAHHITFERCYMHGDPERGTRRGVALNSRETELLDSYFADFKEVGADSQAIAGWNGAGPFRIENNYIEGAGENIMFGGADPSIRNLVPADILIRRNHFKKPLTWKIGQLGYEGRSWTVKNLFELKNARRVLVEGNLFEYNWVSAQAGFAIGLTPRNQDGTAPWSVVEDVTFMNNMVRHAAGGVAILGRDDNFPSGPTRRITIQNNVFDDIGGAQWGGNGRLFQILDGTADVVIEHNTAFHTGNFITAEGGPHTGFAFRDNIALYNTYGIAGNGLFPGGEFRGNVIVGGDPSVFPSSGSSSVSTLQNFFPRFLDDVGFVDYGRGRYRLREDSPYKHAATDGKDIGADIDALEATLNAAVKESRN